MKQESFLSSIGLPEYLGSSIILHLIILLLLCIAYQHYTSAPKKNNVLTAPHTQKMPRQEPKVRVRRTPAVPNPIIGKEQESQSPAMPKAAVPATQQPQNKPEKKEEQKAQRSEQESPQKVKEQQAVSVPTKAEPTPEKVTPAEPKVLPNTKKAWPPRDTQSSPSESTAFLVRTCGISCTTRQKNCLWHNAECY